VGEPVQKRVRTATDTPEDGKIVQTTTTRRVIPADPVSAERKTPDFWEYIEKIHSSEWDRHLLYLYRRQSDAGPMIPLEKCSGFMAMPDGTQVALNNREEVEFAIAKKHGGGTYRLILKRGSERVTEGRVMVDGPPKQFQPMADSATMVTSVTEPSATADVAKQAMNLVASREEQAVNVAVNALRGAAEVVQRISTTTNQPATPNPADDLMRQAFVAVMQRMMNPPDPLDLLTKVLALQQQMGTGTSSPGSPILSKVLDTALERMLNPPPSGPVASAGAELVRQLPQVANYVSEAIREWRIGVEAQRDAAALMTGKPPNALPPGPARPGQVAPPQPVPTVEPRPNPAPGMQGPSVEFLETKLIEILKEPISTEEAADEALAFLDRMDAQLPNQLAMLGEQGLLQLFQTRPILQQATQNLPRLQEFIRAFLKYAQDNGRPTAPGEKKPN
jgi:hypothetical protein